MTDQIKKLRKLRGLSQADLAAMLGIDVANYNRLENQKTELTLSRMKQIGEALRCEPIELIADFGRTRPVSVRRYLEAGSWLKSNEWPDADWYQILVPDDLDLRGRDLHGAEARGPSMNKVYPEGSVIVYADAPGSNDESMINSHVVVERIRIDGQVEITVKKLVRDEDGKHWLMPESTDPRHQQPLQVDHPENHTVNILGPVRYSLLRNN